MRTFSLVITLLVWQLSCQTATKQADANSTGTLADSTALLAKRPGPEAPRSAADRLVRALYFEHNKTGNPFREVQDRSLIDQFFAKPTGDGIWKYVQKGGGKGKAAGRNPLFDAPDKAIHKTWVEPAAVAGSRAVVYVTFLNETKPEEIRLDLQQVAGRWRIADMRYPNGTQLTQLMPK